MKIYGYVRVSTVKQSIKRQEDDIKKVYPDAIIVTDECTGKNLDRPGWTKLYKALKPGDTVVFDEVSRFSRDAEEGFQVYEELYNKGINLIFLKEPMINTENYRTSIRQQIDAVGDEIADTYIEATNKVLMILAKKQIKIAFERSQGEIVFHGQRTKEGINQARLNGKQIGQVKGAKLTTKKSIEAKKIIFKRSKDFHGDLSDVEVMKLTGLARGTYYKYKRELKADPLGADPASAFAQSREEKKQSRGKKIAIPGSETKEINGGVVMVETISEGAKE